jgi:hypothetical protein
VKARSGKIQKIYTVVKNRIKQRKLLNLFQTFLNQNK